MDNPQQADLAYAAGYFDGEGSLQLRYTVSQKSFNAAICSSDYATLKWFQDLFGGSLASWNGGNSLTKKQMWNWKTSGHGTYTFISLILPYLKYKREHATHCMLAWEIRSNTEQFKVACEERKLRWGRAAAETK